MGNGRRPQNSKDPIRNRENTDELRLQKKGGLVAALLFHAMNGIRVILIDFWSEGARNQRLMLWIIAVVYLLLMVPSGVVLGIHMMDHFR